MRDLQIERKKTYVGCLAKMRVYVEDRTARELTIHGVPCRKLGTLKNGEIGHFQIPDEAVRVFVIADAVSREFCCDVYEVPAGTEGVSLCGQCHFNPACGTAFCFENNPSPEATKQRRRGLQIGVIILIVAFAIGAAVGAILGIVGALTDLENTDTVAVEELRIDLPASFFETMNEQYTAAFTSPQIAVFIYKEDGNTLESWCRTREDYANSLRRRIGVMDTEHPLTWWGDMIYFQYEGWDTETGDTYSYWAFVYEHEGTFWLVEFATHSDNHDTYEERIRTWADSVVFED